MAASFYFYDLETSGIRARSSRIMQFAGQRTDLDLKPIGEPDNMFIKLSSDILPDPDAVLITGITPQQTQADGGSEVEFLRYLTEHIAIPDTIIVGFNNIRFDDEFMRFTLWRNFYDPYEWQWKDGRGRWDLLDVVRLTRALRPDGINWPFASDGSPSNRLELLTAVNKLDHTNSHDALADVHASIAIAKLIRTKQPRLYNYLFKMRDKKLVKELVDKTEPFVYACSRYSSDYEKTSVSVMVASHPKKQAALVYDLRFDPTEFIDLSAAELAARMQYSEDKSAPARLPVKTLSYNKCPAVAPLAVLDDDSAERLQLNTKQISNHLKILNEAKDFGSKLRAAEELSMPKSQTMLTIDELTVDEQLYDGFVPDGDKTKMSVVRAAEATELAALNLDFADERLTKLLPLYKARNFPVSLSEEEQLWWEGYRSKRLLDGGQQSRAAKYFRRLEELSKSSDLSQQDRYLLEELNLYGQSIVPFG